MTGFNVGFNVTLVRHLPDDGLGTETCRSSFSVLTCKFYISALVGIIIEWLDSMHGVTMKKNNIYLKFIFEYVIIAL